MRHEGLAGHAGVSRLGRGLVSGGLAGACALAPAAALPAVIDAVPVPLATQRVAASADECVVWNREASFARSMQQHDAAAFAAHLHPGAVFNNGAVAPDRGRDAIVREWSAMLAGERLALRWRPGIVNIGGDPDIAVSRGPFILQIGRGAEASYRVGLYQTVWVRSRADETWRVLFDGSASDPLRMADRAEADRWVEARPMSDCAPP